MFIGDCARFEGQIGDQRVKIESLYRDRSTKDPYVAKHDDIYANMATVTGKLALNRNEPTLRLEGCPVSVAEQVLALVSLGKVNNPYLSPDQVVRFNKGYLAWRGNTVAKRLSGTPYQIPGPCSRGEAAPEVGEVSG